MLGCQQLVLLMLELLSVEHDLFDDVPTKHDICETSTVIKTISTFHSSKPWVYIAGPGPQVANITLRSAKIESTNKSIRTYLNRVFDCSDEVFSSCGRPLNVSTGITITSPNYPSNYDINVLCQWIVTSAAPDEVSNRLNWRQSDYGAFKLMCDIFFAF